MLPWTKLTAGLLGAATLAGASAAWAEPAMWVIRDKDSTIYLLGTVHVLKPDVQWRSAKLDKAIKDAGDLTLEIEEVDEKSAAALGPLMQTYGVDTSAKLSAKLSAEDNARLAKVAQSLGVPPAAFDPLRPWLAALQLAVAPLIKAGYQPNAGVDRLVKAAAVADGDKVQSFETVEQQIRFFADLPESVQIEYLHSTLRDYENAVADLDKIATGWAAGDTKALEDVLVKEFKTDAPNLYQVLIVQRNQAWAKSLEEKLKGSGVSLVAVGAAHLVGPDSVQAFLAKDGVAAERY